jgi:hypothetical protein
MVDRVPVPRRNSRRLFAAGIMIVGVLLLVMVPVVLVVLAFGHVTDFHMPGTLVILSATGGMALLAVGAALFE